MVAGLGFSASEAASVSVMANLCGVAGGMSLGWFAGRFGVKRLTLWSMLGVGVCTALFGFAPADIGLLRLSGGIAGFFIFASMIGLYSIISRSFPTYVRATGTGLIIGIGRVGSALAPVVAGLLFTAGVGRGLVSTVMGVAAVLAALLLGAFTVRAPTH
jgi:MFS family permease